MNLSVRVGLAFLLLAWALAAAVLSAGGGVDVLLVLLLVGLLGLRELMAREAPERLRARLGVFVFLGVMAFLYVLVQRVRDALNL